MTTPQPNQPADLDTASTIRIARTGEIFNREETGVWVDRWRSEQYRMTVLRDDEVLALGDVDVLD